MKRLLFILCAWMMMAMSAHAETYDLTIGDYESEFFEADNDVYMLMHSVDEAMTIRLDIIVEAGQQFFTNGKTYTWEEMLHTFCNVYVRDEYREYKFADASFTWSKDEQGLEHIAGSATDSLGNIYNFHYDVQPYIPTGDTLDIAFEHSLRMEHDEYWYFSGTEGDYYILLTLINETSSPVGHYTAENMDMSYSYIDRPGEGGDHEIFLFHDADITITEAANDTFKIEGFIAAKDGNVYNLHLFYMEPKPLVKDTITATNLYINTDYLYGMVGAIQVEASNDTYYLKFALTPESADLNIYETYIITPQSPHIGYITDYTSAEEESSEVYKGTVSLMNTDSGIVMSGTILCYDNIEYTLNVTYLVPEKTREANLRMEELELQISNQGAWRISGYNADSTQFISLVFNNFGVAGTYDFAHISPLYAYVVTDIIWEGGEVDSYNYFNVVDVDLNVDWDAINDEAIVTGVVRARNKADIPEFTVYLKGKTPSAEGLEQTSSASQKATKRLQNGVLVIEKNGIQYNVLGNVIR